jgi:flagellar protein FlbD
VTSVSMCMQPFIEAILEEDEALIKVTRLNNSELWVNAEMIEYLEAVPDTVISLVGRSKVVVKEPPEVIVEAIVAYRQRIIHSRPELIKNTEENASAAPAEADQAS